MYLIDKVICYKCKINNSSNPQVERPVYSFIENINWGWCNYGSLQCFKVSKNKSDYFIRMSILYLWIKIIMFVEIEWLGFYLIK